MTRRCRGTLLVLLVLLVVASIPAPALGQPAPREPAPRGAGDPAPRDPAVDALTPQERDLLAAAEQLARDGAHVLEQWLLSQAITEDRLFARMYFPVGKSDQRSCARPCYATPYDALADRDLVSLEDRTLARAPTLQYAIVTDINGYVPAHNTRFAQPLTGNPEQDYINNRTKRLLADGASLAAARSEARFLIQRVKLDTGDVIYDISVPVTVRGKHWGCARIGYRRAE
jgi:methyl-accepting chemotaxis protein